MGGSYEGGIPPGWDRRDPVGGLIDMTTGAPIRDMHEYGGWIPWGDGLAIREVDFFEMRRREFRSASTDQDQALGGITPSIKLLLLF